MKIKHIRITLIFIIIGAILSFLLNYLLIEDLIIPNPCYYHFNDTTKFFDLFYEITSIEGYHPYPTKLNLISTLTAGAILGLITKYLFRRNYNS